jgi:hypothetical protein
MPREEAVGGKADQLLQVTFGFQDCNAEVQKAFEYTVKIAVTRVHERSRQVTACRSSKEHLVLRHLRYSRLTAWSGGCLPDT